MYVHHFTRDSYLRRRTDGLAASGNAPKIFLRVTKHGLPWVAIIFQSLFGLLAYMALKEGPGRVFGW